MEEFSELKSARLLSIYARLLNGRVLKKALLAQEFGVTARSIQRDLESLRSFLSNEMLPQDVVDGCEAVLDTLFDLAAAIKTVR